MSALKLEHHDKERRGVESRGEGCRDEGLQLTVELAQSTNLPLPACSSLVSCSDRHEVVGHSSQRRSV